MDSNSLSTNHSNSSISRLTTISTSGQMYPPDPSDPYLVKLVSNYNENITMEEFTEIMAKIAFFSTQQIERLFNFIDYEQNGFIKKDRLTKSHYLTLLVQVYYVHFLFICMLL